MRRLTRLAWGLSLVLLYGCIKVDETLTVAPDGSGTLEMVYGMSEQTIAQMEAMRRMAQQMSLPKGSAEQSGRGSADTGLEFDPEALRQEFKRHESQGVHLESAATEIRNGWRFTHIKVHFELLQGLLDTGIYKERNLSLVKRPDGNYMLALTERHGRDKHTRTAGKAQMEQVVATMLAGFHVATTVIVPGDILETNAHHHVGRSATWEYDINKDKAAFIRMGEEHPYLIFDGRDLNLPDARAAAKPER
jgi:hypothetical protein